MLSASSLLLSAAWNKIPMFGSSDEQTHSPTQSQTVNHPVSQLVHLTAKQKMADIEFNGRINSNVFQHAMNAIKIDLHQHVHYKTIRLTV